MTETNTEEFLLAMELIDQVQTGEGGVELLDQALDLRDGMTPFEADGIYELYCDVVRTV